MRRLLASLALAVLAACGADAPPGIATPVSSNLEDLAALGYVGWDEEQLDAFAAHGEPSDAPFLYADDRSTVRLVGNDGQLLRSWQTPEFDQVEFAELLPGGGVICVSVDQGVVRLDAESRVVWRFDGNAHHEIAPRADGGFVVPVWRVETYRGRHVRFDELVYLSAEGAVERRWSTFVNRELLAEHHEPLLLDTEPETAGDEHVYDQFHINSIVELRANQLGLDEPAGSLLVCARNANLVFVLDVASNTILWSTGPGLLDFPHTPVPTARGVLVFDNGFHRGWSRVIELEPRTGEILWQWSASERGDFFSKTRGSCQRLSNGNTFVCESERGRLFELSPAGEVVWSWANTERRGEQRRRIYRARRIESD